MLLGAHMSVAGGVDLEDPWRLTSSHHWQGLTEVFPVHSWHPLLYAVERQILAPSARPVGDDGSQEERYPIGAGLRIRNDEDITIPDGSDKAPPAYDPLGESPGPPAEILNDSQHSKLLAQPGGRTPSSIEAPAAESPPGGPGSESRRNHRR